MNDDDQTLKDKPTLAEETLVDSDQPQPETSAASEPESVASEDTAATETPVETAPTEESVTPVDSNSVSADELTEENGSSEATDEFSQALLAQDDTSDAKWYVVHTYSGHENRVATSLKQRVESEHLETKILDVLVPTQDKIEIKGGKKGTVKEKIFPGYILVKMVLDDASWLAVRTTQGVTGFVGMGNKPTPISQSEVRSIVKFMSQGSQPTYKNVYSEGDTVKIVDGPFAEFIGKVDNVDQDRGKVRVLVSIFGRETPVELDFLQVQKL